MFGEHLAEILVTKLGAHRAKTDSQVFWGRGDVHMAVHADDIVVAGSKDIIEETWKRLQQSLVLKVNGFISRDERASSWASGIAGRRAGA